MDEYRYTIVGYHAGSDSYVKYAEMTSFEDAVNEAKMLGLSCRRGTLTHLCGTCIDWIEIYSDWSTPYRRAVWGSYDLCVSCCANV